jgi:hypothetical protein
MAPPVCERLSTVSNSGGCCVIYRQGDGTGPSGPQSVCSRDAVFKDIIEYFEKPSTTHEARGVLASLTASLVEHGVDRDLLSQTWLKLDASAFGGLEPSSDLIFPWDARILQLAAAIAPGLVIVSSVFVCVTG